MAAYKGNDIKTGFDLSFWHAVVKLYPFATLK